jgi:hypothetical protein
MKGAAMFGEFLSEPERKILVQAFAYLAHCDQQVKTAEIDRISTLARNIGLDPEIVVHDGKTLNIAALVKPITDDVIKRIMLEELIVLAHTDGEYSPEEHRRMREIATCLGIDILVLEQVEGWVEQGIVWRKAGEQLILKKG